MNTDTRELKKTGYEPLPPDEKEIDRLLEEMAETTPEMPADFHDKWMNAVREEAGIQKSPVSQWPRILSVAAAFVLLIGGVILLRSNGQKQQTPDTSALLASEKAADGAMVSAETAEAVEEAEPAEDAMAAPLPEAKARQEDKPVSMGIAMSTNAPAEEKAVALMASGAAYEAESDAYEAEEAEEAYAANAAPEAAYSDMAAEAAFEADMAYGAPDLEAWFAEPAKKIGDGILKLLSAVTQTESK